jgi:hypothetical protein
MHRISVFIVAIAVVLLAGTLVGTARAYSIASGTSQPSLPFNVNGILAPFENFFNSMNSVSITGQSTTAVTRSAPPNSIVTNGVRSGFQRFDAWRYGIAGFHISGIFITSLSMFSWLLGVVKGGVDWLLHTT